MLTETFAREFGDAPNVRGFLDRPEADAGIGVVLAHGAGGDARAPVPASVARALTDLGITVLRCDLPFRQARPHGPPPRGADVADREGLRRAATALRGIVSGEVWIGGHSYGGRQASMLLAEGPDIAAGLLLLSYPLHPPNRPEQLRTAHFPKLAGARALFVHGTADPFATIEELRAALPGGAELLVIEGAGHDLGVRGRPRQEVAAEIAYAFAAFAGLVPADAVEIPIGDVFDLHTVSPREVKAVVEAYLEEAHRRGLTALRIIHGRGIGVAREIVRDVLVRTPFVLEFGDAPAEAGGWGATVVTLRQVR